MASSRPRKAAPRVRRAWWKRIIVMLGGPAMNLVLAVLCLTIVMCGFGVKEVTTTVGSVTPSGAI